MTDHPGAPDAGNGIPYRSLTKDEWDTYSAWLRSVSRPVENGIPRCATCLHFFKNDEFYGGTCYGIKQYDVEEPYHLGYGRLQEGPAFIEVCGEPLSLFIYVSADFGCTLHTPRPEGK